MLLLNTEARYVLLNRRPVRSCILLFVLKTSLVALIIRILASVFTFCECNMHF